MLRKNVAVRVSLIRPGDMVKDDMGRVLSLRNIRFRLNWDQSSYYEITTEDPEWSIYLAENKPIIIYKRQPGPEEWS